MLSTTSLCELQVDGGFFAAQDAARLQERLAKNRELRLSSLDHSHLGADAPPTSSASGGGGGRARPTGGVGEGHSWGGEMRLGAPASGAGGSGGGQVPVLGVLFSYAKTQAGRWCRWTCSISTRSASSSATQCARRGAISRCASSERRPIGCVPS